MDFAFSITTLFMNGVPRILRGKRAQHRNRLGRFRPHGVIRVHFGGPDEPVPVEDVPPAWAAVSQFVVEGSRGLVLTVLKSGTALVALRMLQG